MSYDRWLKHRDVWRVIAAAPEDRDAREAALSRIIDTMLEIQLDYSRVSPGWPPVSSTALACAAASGELMGGGYGSGDPMLTAYGRTWKGSPWHEACAWLMGRMPARSAAAMLMQAARIRPTKRQVGGWWCKTAAQLLERQEQALQLLGMRGLGIEPFDSVRTWQLHAKDARDALREALRTGEVNNVYLRSKKVIDEA